jgi:hypothetical protein
MKCRSARPDENAIAEDQALVVQLAKGAGERHAAGETPRIGEHPAGQRREGQHIEVLAKDHSQHDPLYVEFGPHPRTVRRRAAAGCST